MTPPGPLVLSLSSRSHLLTLLWPLEGDSHTTAPTSVSPFLKNMTRNVHSGGSRYGGGGGFLVPFLPLLCELLITPRYKLKTRVKIVKESKSDAS